MRRILVGFILVVVLPLNAMVASAQVEVTNSVIAEVNGIFNSLFEALKNGDVKKIKLYLPADYYARRQALFEKNKDYPAFLRKFYQGASLRVGQIESVMSAKEDVMAEFIVDFPGGDTTTTGMRLRKNKGGGWSIIKLLADKTDQGEPFGEARK